MYDINFDKIAFFSVKTENLTWRVKLARVLSIILFITYESWGSKSFQKIQQDIFHQQSDSLDILRSVTTNKMMDSGMVKNTNLEDSLVHVLVDSAITPSDSSFATAAQTDSINNKTIGDVKTTVFYQSRDSINMIMETQNIFLYGEGETKYGDIELSAENIRMDYGRNELFANGVKDSTGKLIGKPLFKDKDAQYLTRKIKYNFTTRKAYITGVVTEQGEGLVHSEEIKKNEKGEFYGRRGKYTTCNLEHPHFYIQTNKLKMIQQDKIVTGAFNLNFNDVPTPMGFLFGIFPVPRRQKSGILFPKYGEERIRGFFLRDGGYYFHFNDYINLTLTGELYSKGQYGLNAASQYKKRYAFSGNTSFNLSQIPSTNPEESAILNSYWFRWTHSPDSRKRSSRFSASVSLGSSSYNRNISTDYNSVINSSFNSNVTYSKTFRGTPFSLTASARHNQNVITNEINTTFPDMSWNMNRLYPFTNLGSGKTWYNKLTFSYSGSLTNRITNRVPISTVLGVRATNENRDTVLDVTSENIPIILKQSINGIQHRIPISTSFNVLKYLTISPSINFSSAWYRNHLRHSWDSNLNKIVSETIDQFSVTYEYNTSIGASTRLYGIYFPRILGIEAIRHIITPRVSASYKPDFSLPEFGFYDNVQTDATGKNYRKISRYQGFLYGGPSAGESGSLSFSLGNNIEMKTLAKNDTVNSFKKIPILNSLSISGGYNFLDDSFQLSNINIRGNTSILNRRVSINFGAVLDPYYYELLSEGVNSRGERTVVQRRRAYHAWDKGQGLGQIISANIALSTSLNPKVFERKKDLEEAANNAKTAEEEALIREAIANPELYVDFKIPWDISINYTARYTKRGFEDSDVTQTFNFRGSLNLTDKWKVSFNSGYDFEAEELTYTTLNVHRDLHCWQLSFNWVPLGPRQSYFLTIQAKGSVLQDLKLDRRKHWFDR